MQVCITLNKIHYSDVIMGAMASQITSLSIVCSPVGSGADKRKHQSSALLAFVRGIHRWPVDSPHKGPVTRKMFPFDDVILEQNRWAWIVATVPGPRLNIKMISPGTNNAIVKMIRFSYIYTVKTVSLFWGGTQIMLLSQHVRWHGQEITMAKTLLVTIRGEYIQWSN